MSVFALMRQVRLVTFLRAFTRGKEHQRFQYAFGAFCVAIAFVFVFGLSLLGFRALLGVEGGGEVAVLALAGLYSISAFALVFVGLAAALYTMYLSEDIDVLASMPIRERTIFAYKFWETLLGNSGLFIALGLPVILAYGVAAGASVLFYPAVLVVSVLVLMLPTALCVLLIMPLMRVLPAGKAKEIVAALTVLAGAAAYLGQSFLTNPDRVGDRSTPSPLRAIAEATILNVPPGSWAADALSGAAFLEWGRMLLGLLPLFVVASGLYAVCLLFTGWAYATGRARAAEPGGRAARRRSGARSGGRVEGLLGFLPQDVRAVAAKELVSIPRDLRRLAVMILPAVVLLAVALRFPGLVGAGVGDRLLLLFYLGVGGFAALFALQSGVQAVGVGAEGRAYWFLAAAPVSPMRLLVGKWAAIVLVGAAFALVGCIVVSVLVGLYLPGFLLGVAAGTAGGAITSLYSVGVSAIFPRFDWENPNQTITTAGGVAILFCFFGLAALAALAVGLALVVGNFLPFWVGTSVAGLLWTVVAAVPGCAIFAAGAGHLKRLDWDL